MKRLLAATLGATAFFAVACGDYEACGAGMPISNPAHPASPLNPANQPDFNDC